MQSITTVFSKLPDPRVERTKQHKLVDIIIICICGTIAGAEGFNEIEDWAKARQSWLQKFLDLSNGIPTHDTLNRVFSMINPRALQEAFLEWLESVNMLLDHKFVAIDGKTLRRSFDKTKNKGALHLVSAWATDVNISLGQVQVSEKSNEITAIPELLNFLDLSGAIITIDAMGTQKTIATKIIEKKADYILALKKNHGDLYDDVSTYFKLESDEQFVGMKTVEKDHGRGETRSFRVTKNIDWFNKKTEWDGLKSVIELQSSRLTGIGKQTSTFYFITSLLFADIELICRGIRSHWSIENKLHWLLDVTFKEDQSRLRHQIAAQNMAFLRKMAISILTQDTSKKISLKRKRFLAGIEENYLLDLLNVKLI